MSQIIEDYFNVYYIFPSRKRTILFNKQPYFLHFPKMVFKFYKDGVSKRIFFIINRELYVPPLPNFFENGDYCLGEEIEISTAEGQLMAVEMFWQSEFVINTCSTHLLWGDMLKALKIYNENKSLTEEDKRRLSYRGWRESKTPFDFWDDLVWKEKCRLIKHVADQTLLDKL